MLSYAHGACETPAASGETIGENLRRTVARPRRREALVVRPRACGSRTPNSTPTWTGSPAGCSRPASRGATGSGSGRPTAPSGCCCSTPPREVGAILVNINPAYRTARAGLRARQSGCRLLFARARSRRATTRRWSPRCAPELPELERVVLIGSTRWVAFLDRRRRRHRRRAGRARGRARLRRPDQHPVHLAARPVPQGRNPHAPQHPQQRVLRRRALRLHRGGPGLHPGALYHCFGMVLGNLGSPPTAPMVCPARFDPARSWRRSRGALHGPLRRADDVHRRARATRLRGARPLSLRTGIMAGSPCPVEVMKQVSRRDAYGRGDHLLRHDGDLARLHPDRARRSHREAGRDRGPRPPPRRSDRRPETGATVPRGAAGELCTRGYSVMRGYWNDPDATAEAIDAEGWMHTGDLATMDATATSTSSAA